ncbi:hypothetical protein CDAR_474891 [Caerostris darwini]|uniref:Uncharacterized protein n=1 Tax=Caerostris darwini TaxID=1538125 RepID=A0AAV4MS66_9ARAC|nr:hypothetical protein CDAR_474891 [Caerostris darwini]
MGDERPSFHLNPALTGGFIQRPRRAFRSMHSCGEAATDGLFPPILSLAERHLSSPSPWRLRVTSMPPRHHAHLHDIQWEFPRDFPLHAAGTEIMKAQSGLRKPVDPSLRVVTNPLQPTKSIRNK